MPDDELRAAHPGAVCRPIGDHGVTKNGTPMVCRIPESGGPHARWGRRDPIIPKTRRRRAGPPRKGTGLRRAAFQQLPEPGSHTVPLPQKLVDQLSESEIGQLRTGAGVFWRGPRAQQRVVDKLKEAGLLDVDGNTTERGVDALRRRGETGFNGTPIETHLVDRASAVVLDPTHEDRSADTGTDWAAYDACPDCSTVAGQPCRDLRTDGGTNATAHPGRPLTDAAGQRVRVLREMEEEKTRQSADEDQQLRDGLAGTEIAKDEAALQRILDSPTLRDDYLRTLSDRRPALAPTAQPAGEDVEQAIRDAYRKVFDGRAQGNDHGYVMLTDVREALGDRFDRATVDHALDKMIEQPNVRLYAEMNQQALTDADRVAAVNIGGEDRHAIRIPQDRSRDAGTDWARYDECPACYADAGQPCRDRRDPDDLISTPHDGRLVIEQPTGPDPAADTRTAAARKYAAIRESASEGPTAFQQLLAEQARQSAPATPTGPQETEPWETLQRTPRTAAVNWNHYGKCDECLAPAGRACVDLRSMTGETNAHPHDGRPLTVAGAKYQALHAGASEGPTAFQQLMEDTPVATPAEPGPAECNGTAMCPKHPLKRGPHRDDPASDQDWYQKILDGRGHEVTDGDLVEALEDATAHPGVEGDGTAAYIRELQQQRADAALQRVMDNPHDIANEDLRTSLYPRKA